MKKIAVLVGGLAFMASSSSALAASPLETPFSIVSAPFKALQSKKSEKQSHRVGASHKVSKASYSPAFKSFSAPQQIEPTGKNEFHFYPSNGHYAAYDQRGELIRTGQASGGANYCPELGSPCRTPSGTYTIYRKGGAECKSSKFPLGSGGAPMPYCMFFHNGYAIHGSPYVPPQNASHGCIRVHPEDARWLSDNFLNNGARVRVYSY